MKKDSRIYIAGHRGLVGSAIVRRLESAGYTNLIVPTHAELDLLDAAATRDFFEETKPEYVFGAAAKVGGILANDTYPAQFIYENLAIQNNLIHNAQLVKVKKFLFLGSSCVYPRACPQPIREEYLLTSELEPTNKAYAIAKIAGIATCQSYNRQYGTTKFVAVMPSNVYGANDNFDLQTSHVIPALIRKFHEAKVAKRPTVTLWGTGAPRREFLHIEDLADACLFVMNHDGAPDLLNIGTGSDMTVKELGEMIRRIVGFEGEVAWDASKPDGT
ncbi:MAG: GDP-L-fucose synthase, partial [Candidatus Liptonbacteria bacterium]|nr:GDP-L-fucose synthase [Candidatus Liptonbacteria bacterium]